MPIIGFNFTKISIEKTNPFTRNSKINHNINITEISQEDIAINQQRKEKVLKFTFDFKVDWENSGTALLQGNILFLDDQKTLQEVHDKWHKEKKIDKTFLTPILNSIIYKSNIRLLELSQDLNLPPHVRLPFLSTEPKEKPSPKAS